MKSSPAWNNSLRLLSGGRFLSSAGLTGISPFIPYYLEGMNAGSPQEVLLWTGLSVSAPALSYALLTPVWGKLGDRWSRKWMVVRALVGLALSMMLMGIAQTPFQFFLFRLCQGAFGGISDASSAFVGSHAPADRRGSALGTLERASAAGLLAGPLLGSLCVHLWGSRPLLFLTAALTLAFALLAAWKLGDAEQSDRQADSSQASRPPDLSAQTDGRGGIGHAFRSLVSHPTISRLVLAGILFKLVDFATFTMFTPYVRQLIPSDAAVLFVGLLLAMSSVGELLGASWWGKRNDRRPPERNLKLAGLLCGVCVLAHAVPLGVPWLMFVRLLQGFAYSALLQTVMLQVLDSSSDRDRGVRIGGLWGLSSVYVVMGLVMLSALFLIPPGSAAGKKAAERLPLQSTKKG